VHHTYRNSRFVELAALLDVELDVARVGAFGDARVGDPFRRAADLADGVRHFDAVPDGVEFAGDEVPGGGAAAGEAGGVRDALLIRPHHDLERPARGDTRFLQCLNRLDGGKRAEVAVEVAAVRHGIDVRAEEHGRERRVSAGAAGEDVAGWIDARL